MGILRRSSWNDSRLDEFSRRTDEGFKEMREGFAAINQRFDRLTNTLLGGTLAMITAIIGAGILG